MPSQFEETYTEYLLTGATKLEAYHRAVDYYRKYTRREITSEWEQYKHTIEDDKSISAYELAAINDVFTKLIQRIQEKTTTKNDTHIKTIKLLCALWRLHRLDELLTEENQKILDQYIGDWHGTLSTELADALGFKRNKSGGFCVTLYKYLHELRDRYREIDQ